jgi:hypothetical protein
VEHLCREVLLGHDPDPDRIAPLIAHVRAHGDAAHGLHKYAEAPGAYQGFAINLPMQPLLRYLYNPEIPQELIKPFSIRSSVWTTPGSAEEQQRLWADPWPPPRTVVVRGEQYDRSTADLSTGGCYGMRLQRVLVFLPDKGALLSVSVQPEPSEVGTKGYLIGRDEDSRYVYSDEEGLTRAGLGWVSSRIQTNVSIGVYLDEGKEVRCGVFQWMRAGWSGLSVIKESHIKDSLAACVTGSGSARFCTPLGPACARRAGDASSGRWRKTCGLKKDPCFEGLGQSQNLFQTIGVVGVDNRGQSGAHAPTGQNLKTRDHSFITLTADLVVDGF